MVPIDRSFKSVSPISKIHIENSSTSGYYTLFTARKWGTFMQRNHQWNKVCHLPSGAI
jgi:hypothetical protein